MVTFRPPNRKRNSKELRSNMPESVVVGKHERNEITSRIKPMSDRKKLIVLLALNLANSWINGAGFRRNIGAD